MKYRMLEGIDKPLSALTYGTSGPAFRRLERQCHADYPLFR